MIYFSCLSPIAFVRGEWRGWKEREEWNVESTFSSTFLMNTSTSYVLPPRSFIFEIPLSTRTIEVDIFLLRGMLEGEKRKKEERVGTTSSIHQLQERTVLAIRR